MPVRRRGTWTRSVSLTDSNERRVDIDLPVTRISGRLRFEDRLWPGNPEYRTRIVADASGKQHNMGRLEGTIFNSSPRATSDDPVGDLGSQRRDLFERPNVVQWNRDASPRMSGQFGGVRKRGPGAFHTKQNPLAPSIAEGDQGVGGGVGTPGFEPGTSCTRSKRATMLRHVPRGLEYVSSPA